jgi:hypothetical protein
METGNRKIVMTGNSLFKDIQSSFSALYPFLMIEFFRHDKEKGSIQKSKIDLSMSVSAFADFTESHAIDMDSNRTVAIVLQDFIDKLGIKVHMCRKSGSVWNAISLTDEWTLERQNAAGEYICSIMGGADGGS